MIGPYPRRPGEDTPAVMLLLLLAACGLSEPDFFDAWPTARCEAYARCAEEETLALFSEADCVNAVRRTWPDCDYDAAAAEACLDEIEAATCAGDGLVDWPASCERVHDCGAEEPAH